MEPRLKCFNVLAWATDGGALGMKFFLKYFNMEPRLKNTNMTQSLR